MPRAERKARLSADEACHAAMEEDEYNPGIDLPDIDLEDAKAVLELFAEFPDNALLPGNADDYLRLLSEDDLLYISINW